MELSVTNICGVDYGSKTAGTTGLAYADFISGTIYLKKSPKNFDADKWIFDQLVTYRINHVFVDAPLSLPIVYKSNSQSKDFFYRSCDRELHAMSPMFLGGLTARAMQLKANLSDKGIRVTEVYPKACVQLFPALAAIYKNDLDACFDFILTTAQLKDFDLQMETAPDWHMFDSMMCLISGIRFINSEHDVYGNEKEGLIIV